MADLIFDKYEVIRRLAVGGMGEIFLARQVGTPGFERLAILKTLLPNVAEQEGMIDQFLDEARVVATLNHPNVVAIYEVGSWEGVYIIAMEYIRGVDLSTILTCAHKQKVQMPPTVAARIIHDAALGLDHAHHAKDTQGNPLNIVHRDISPQNIMVRDDGVTKVVDFGIAKAANRQVRTSTGLVKGKISYMPVEQVLSGALDGRSDQWALGVVFWELVTGRRLFGGQNPVAVIQQITSGTILRPSEINTAVPAEIDEVILHMLEREADLRYERCVDVARDLKNYLSSSSLEVAEVEVAAYVTALCGERIQRITRDLTPSGQNFLAALKPEVEETIAIRPNRRRVFAGIGLGAAIFAVAAAIALWPAPPEAPVAEPVVPAAEAMAPEPVKPPAPVGPAVLEITSTPPKALVSVGETILGTTPLTTKKLSADTKHLLALSLRGYESAEITVELAAGQTTLREVQLTKRARSKKGRSKATNLSTLKGGSGQADSKTAAVDGPGFLTIRTKPWAKLTIGGKSFGHTPLFKVKVDPGEHAAHFVNAGSGIDTTRKIRIESGKTTKVEFSFAE